MIRVLAEIFRRGDLNRDAFCRHYETNHAPLALATGLQFRVYRRHHLLDTLRDVDIDLPDCLSEFGYADAAAFDAVRALLASPAGDAIRADELRFMDKTKNRFATVIARRLFAADDPVVDAVAFFGVDAADPTAVSALEACLGRLADNRWRPATLAVTDRVDDGSRRIYATLVGDAGLPALRVALIAAGAGPLAIASVAAGHDRWCEATPE